MSGAPTGGTENHYHGDLVRMLFITAAVLMFLAEFIGSTLPFTPATALAIIIVLVIAAGITNPKSRFIQWFNVFLSVGGTVLFGSIAIERLHGGSALFSKAGVIALITIVFLTALYLSTRTLRAYTQHLINPNNGH